MLKCDIIHMSTERRMNRAGLTEKGCNHRKWQPMEKI